MGRSRAAPAASWEAANSSLETVDGSPGTRSDHHAPHASEERRRTAEGSGGRYADPPGGGRAAGCALLPGADRADPGSEPASGAESDRRTRKAAGRRTGIQAHQLSWRAVRHEPAGEPATRQRSERRSVDPLTTGR